MFDQPNEGEINKLEEEKTSNQAADLSKPELSKQNKVEVEEAKKITARKNKERTMNYLEKVRL